MKKLLFISLVATAMLAGCSNDEMVETTQSGAIRFDGFVNKSTRGVADDITTASISNFSVYGFMTDATGQIFTGEAVTKGADNAWTYINTQYWTAGKEYWFSAIAPTTDAQWTYAVNSKVEGGIITFENGDGTQDLLYAYSGKVSCTTPAEQGAVSFTFNHLLSHVKFNFTNSMGNDNITLKVTEVKITDADNKATCDVSAATKTWTPATDNVAGDLAFGSVLATDAKIANAGSSATDHKYMIPQKKAYTLSFKVVMYQGAVEAATYTHTGVEMPEVEMAAGFSYVFNAELTAKNIDPDGELYPIEFTVTKVEDWEDFAGETVTIPETTTPEP